MALACERKGAAGLIPRIVKSVNRRAGLKVGPKNEETDLADVRTPGQSLCCDCGLCCDGSIFADVELTGEAESVGLEILGLECDEEEGRELLIQPCRGLKGAVCQIYEHRPTVCRTFECQVLKDFNAGVVTRKTALDLIQRVRGLQSEGEKEAAGQIVAQRFLGFAR